MAKPRSRVYAQKGGPLVDVASPPVFFSRAPTSSDTNYNLGQIWVFFTDPSSWILAANPATGSATWQKTASTGDAALSKFVVDADGTADYTTIQLALTAANTAGGGTVYVRPGTYTESLTLYDNTEVVGAVGFMQSQNVIITGVHTPPVSGTFSFANVVLTSATDVFNSAVAGTAALNCFLCQFNLTSGAVFDLANWTGTLFINECDDVSTLNSISTNTGGSSLFISDATIGVGATPAITSGPLGLANTEFSCPWDFQTGSVLDVQASEFTNTLTFSNDSTGTITDSLLSTGAAAAITFSSSAVFSLINSTVISSNSPAIDGAGAGVFTLLDNAFPLNAETAGTLTLASGTIKGGNFLSEFVVSADGLAPYSTIQAALTAANTAGGGTVYVRPGSYTEDLTLFDNTEVVGAVGFMQAQNVTITGIHTPPTSGNFAFSNLVLASATDIFSSVAAGTAALSCFLCQFNLTLGWIFEVPSWTGTLFINECDDVSTVNAISTNTGGSSLFISDATIGVGATPAITSGPLGLANTEFSCPWDFQTGSVLDVQASEFTNTLTFSNDSTGTITDSLLSTGAAAAITYNSSGDTTISNCTINTSNVPAISGTATGTLTYESISFLDSNGIDTMNLPVAQKNTKMGDIDVKAVRATGFDINFNSSPSIISGANTGGVATGGASALNILTLQEGVLMEQFMATALAQTIIKPVMGADGLLVSLDLTSGDGVEYNFGATRNRNPYNYIIDGTQDFFFQVSSSLDPAGGNPYFIGFRKIQANQAVFANYTDYYGIGINTVTSAANVVLSSELNGGGQTLQDSGDAWTGGAGGVTTLKVLVTAAGVVTATIDGSAPSTPLAFTFDTGDRVAPFCHYLHNAGAAAINWNSMSVGFQ